VDRPVLKVRVQSKSAGEGATPTTSATWGHDATNRATAPVPQPTSRTRACGGNTMSER
jgi:hypothetical protein